MKSPLVKLPVSRHGCWPKEAPLVLLRILHRALIILCDSRAMVLHFVSICDGNGSWPMTSSLDCGTSALAPTRLGCISSETQVRPMCPRHAGGLQHGHLGSGGHHHYEEPGAPHSVPGVQGPPPPQHKWAVGSALFLVSFAHSFMGLLSFLTFSGAGSHSWASP